MRKTIDNYLIFEIGLSGNERLLSKLFPNLWMIIVRKIGPQVIDIHVQYNDIINGILCIDGTIHYFDFDTSENAPSWAELQDIRNICRFIEGVLEL